jgi:hypothetical protein
MSRRPAKEGCDGTVPFPKLTGGFACGAGARARREQPAPHGVYLPVCPGSPRVRCARPCIPCVSRVCPGSPRCLFYRYRVPMRVSRVPAPPGVFLPVKRHRGEPGHTRDTRDTRTHKGTQTNHTTNQTHQQQTPRTLVGWDACEVRQCDSCVRVCPGSPRCLFTGTWTRTIWRFF